MGSQGIGFMKLLLIYMDVIKTLSIASASLLEHIETIITLISHDCSKNSVIYNLSLYTVWYIVTSGNIGNYYYFYL